MFGFLTKAFSRNSDPIACDEAAETVPVEQLEGLILRTLRSWPEGLTCIELAHILGVGRDSISPRMKPLEEKKRLVYRDGTRRVCGSRSATTVWQAEPRQARLPLREGA